MVTIKSSEEFNGIVTLFLENGTEVSFPTRKLEDFILDRGLNVSVENHGFGLVCDPNGVDDYVDVEVPVEKWLDDNFDEAVERYYREVIAV